jgi:type II secretory pathway component PulF
MNERGSVVEYELPATTRRPVTNWRIMSWLIVLFGTIFFISRWVVPWFVSEYRTSGMPLPGITVVFLRISGLLAGVFAAGIFAAGVVLLPMMFARFAWNENLPSAHFAYRRLLVIHVVTCASLLYLLIATLCLGLPYLLFVRQMG